MMTWQQIEQTLASELIFSDGNRVLRARLSDDGETAQLRPMEPTRHGVDVDVEDLADWLAAGEAGSKVRDLQELGSWLARIWEDPRRCNARRV
jgi:hypothetical protein